MVAEDMVQWHPELLVLGFNGFEIRQRFLLFGLGILILKISQFNHDIHGMGFEDFNAIRQFTERFPVYPVATGLGVGVMQIGNQPNPDQGLTLGPADGRDHGCPCQGEQRSADELAAAAFLRLWRLIQNLSTSHFFLIKYPLETAMPVSIFLPWNIGILHKAFQPMYSFLDRNAIVYPVRGEGCRTSFPQKNSCYSFGTVVM